VTGARPQLPTGGGLVRSGSVRVVPDPIPPATVTRYVWAYLEDRELLLSYAFKTEEEARRIGRPTRPDGTPKRAALLELVLPRDEIRAAIEADTPGA